MEGLRPLKLELIYQDDHGILAYNKEAGQSVISLGSDYPLVFDTIRSEHPNGAHAHRIDTFTSGVVMAGADHSALSYLSSNWRHAVRKFYLCIIEKPWWKDIIISAPLYNQSAQTGFKTLQVRGEYALVRAELMGTGRQWQIRRHLRQVLRLPIVGDKRFKGAPYEFRAGQLLHAWIVELYTPSEDWNISGSITRIQASVPDDFKIGFPEFDWDDIDANANKPLKRWWIQPTGNGRMR